jgi:hypothetical protein
MRKKNLKKCEKKPEKNTKKAAFTECFTLALGKEVFAKCFFLYSAKVTSLPSVFYLTLDKAFFAECPKKNTRQSLRHSAKKRIPVVRCNCTT